MSPGTPVSSDIRAGAPLVNAGKTNHAIYPKLEDRERDAECVREQLHIHVWPDIVGINVAPHGDTISLGLFGWTSEIPAAVRTRPGLLFAWRTRRAIARIDGKIRRLKARRASIDTVFVELAEPKVEVR